MINVLSVTRQFFTNDADWDEWLRSGTVPDKLSYIRTYKKHKPDEKRKQKHKERLDKMPGGNKKPITEQQIQRINSLLMSGSRQSAVAREMNIGASTVNKYALKLKEAGAEVPRARRSAPAPAGKRIPLLLTQEEYDFVIEWRKE